MKKICILSESAALGSRLRGILYQAGYTDILLSDLNAIRSDNDADILIIYAKSRISDIIRTLGNREAAVILLLNPDCYALYSERARHAGITLLLMPAAPETLLDTVAIFS